MAEDEEGLADGNGEGLGLGDVAEAAKPRQRIRLESAADIRRELVRVYRDVAKGRISDIGGVRRARVLAEIRATIVDSEIETRVRALSRGEDRTE